MLKIYLSLTFFLIYFDLTGQNIEVAGGLNKNDFYDYGSPSTVHFLSRYYPGSGYFLAVSVDHIIDSLPFKFTLKIDNYKGNLFTTDGSLGGGSSTTAEVDKLNIGLDAYPVNLNLSDWFEINVGISFSYLLHEKMKGHQSSWQINTTGHTISLDDNSINTKFNFGLIARFTPKIAIGNRLSLLPQYLFYYELTDEFRNEADSKSYRHYFGIGIMKKI